MAELGRLGGVERPLGATQEFPRGANRRCGEAEREIGEGAVVGDRADEPAHHAEATAAHDRTGYRGQPTRHHPQQRRLTSAVRADQCDLPAVAHPERDVGEQLTPVGQHVPDGHGLHMSHESGAWRVWRPGVERIAGTGENQAS